MAINLLTIQTLAMKSIRVVVIEDHEETRQMLVALINSHDGYVCAAAFANAEEAIADIGSVNAQVALVDIHLPGMSGAKCVARLKKQYPETQFIMCTSLEDSETIFEALQAGATGYLTKTTEPEKILDAIADAYNGGAPMNSHIARKVIGFFQNKPGQNTELNKLSAREQEILQYLSKGYRYKEMAALLYISIETVRKHIHNIYEKLQVNSRTDALNKAYAATK